MSSSRVILFLISCLFVSCSRSKIVNPIREIKGNILVKEIVCKDDKNNIKLKREIIGEPLIFSDKIVYRDSAGDLAQATGNCSINQFYK